MAWDTDLIIVGGGPAGCAAAVMASSLGLRCVLVEPVTLCHKLRHIPSTTNVLGGFASGGKLAGRITADVARAARCQVRLGRAAAGVRTFDDHVRVDLDDGETLHAPYAVVATGVRPQATAEVDWIDQDGELTAKPLWEADPLPGAQVLVLGVDRPLGTLLRSHPDVDMRLVVLYSAAEQYKADEVRDDPRVALLPTAHLELRHGTDGLLRLRAVDDTGEERNFAVDNLYLNLGSHPVVPAGDVRADASGYCPPGIQHPRILVAGDLRSARYQRILTAYGSGAEAALTAYYARNDVPHERPSTVDDTRA
ncbi:FAD-dependent oxidoreductase [Planosporangium flavigriseum]|uniref:Oxidoreductase n=1 Tax=Planosporangium flavigriseum TaxID=373681 RepID=A0A8J3LJU3_9ACTN|nr:FAD-dependent oxidoreductase [Planosporangium flavigriseum]NJC66972.1 FAD-dependent oxidoreductase [Planosporangium flavigriseum]GIG73962.1 oxidoreductase [Planosporangium flavigriseum]